jgi:hypothetical protein
MFVKLGRSRGHTYAQIVESFRDGNGQPHTLPGGQDVAFQI